jgi:PilZ domain
MTANTDPHSPPKDSAQPPAGNPADRRVRARQSYSTLQWVAPCPDTGLPDPGSFQQVRCHDISRGGIAYLCQIPPTETLVVFALRSGAETNYLKARVASCVQVVEGKHMCYRVGCEFVDRVQLGAKQADAETAAQPSR